MSSDPYDQQFVLEDGLFRRSCFGAKAEFPFRHLKFRTAPEIKNTFLPPLFLPPSPPPPVNYHPRPFMYHPEGISEQPPELFPSAVVDGRGGSRAEKRAIALIQFLSGWFLRIHLTIRTGRTLSFYTFPSANFFGGVYSNPTKQGGVEMKKQKSFSPQATQRHFQRLEKCCAFELFDGRAIPAPHGALTPQLLTRNDLSINSYFCRCMEAARGPRLHGRSNYPPGEARRVQRPAGAPEGLRGAAALPLRDVVRALEVESRAHSHTHRARHLYAKYLQTETGLGCCGAGTWPRSGAPWRGSSSTGTTLRPGLGSCATTRSQS